MTKYKNKQILNHYLLIEKIQYYKATGIAKAQQGTAGTSSLQPHTQEFPLLIMALRGCFIRGTRYGTLMGNHQMDKHLHTRRKPKPKLTFQHQCVVMLNKQRTKNRQI